MSSILLHSVEYFIIKLIVLSYGNAVNSSRNGSTESQHDRYEGYKISILVLQKRTLLGDPA